MRGFFFLVFFFSFCPSVLPSFFIIFFSFFFASLRLCGATYSDAEAELRHTRRARSRGSGHPCLLRGRRGVSRRACAPHAPRALPPPPCRPSVRRRRPTSPVQQRPQYRLGVAVELPQPKLPITVKVCRCSRRRRRSSPVPSCRKQRRRVWPDDRNGGRVRRWSVDRGCRRRRWRRRSDGDALCAAEHLLERVLVAQQRHRRRRGCLRRRVGQRGEAADDHAACADEIRVVQRGLHLGQLLQHGPHVRRKAPVACGCGLRRVARAPLEGVELPVEQRLLRRQRRPRPRKPCRDRRTFRARRGRTRRCCRCRRRRRRHAAIRGGRPAAVQQGLPWRRGGGNGGRVGGRRGVGTVGRRWRRRRRRRHCRRLRRKSGA
eukprot:Rhum_TRINITY_DN14096_c0_g2::Rhum_TRINITY_DN14096_c0_g2_i1::g.67398::m.67398